MRYLFIIFILNCSLNVFSQELFVVTEPASNMPSGSIGLRVGQSLMKRKFDSGYEFNSMPEIMYGANKNLMLHTSIYLSNRDGNSNFEGGSFYAKYRVFSVDDIHSHFRIALYGRASFNNSIINEEEIETMGHNSGFETGFVATQLINKLAISSSFSYEKALDNGSQNPFPDLQSSSAVNYTLSFGKLVYPKVYTNLKQTNINLMLELMGQRLNENKKTFLDIVPSIQFIINSQARIDLAYKKEIYSDMLRNAPNGVYMKLEYTFFNIRD